MLDQMMFQLLGDGSSYLNMMKQAETTTNQVTNQIAAQVQQVTKFGNSITNHAQMTISSLKMQLTSLLGIASAAGAIGLGVKLARDAEQAQIQFGVMLHDADKAAKMMAQIERFAADTPLQTAGIQQAAKTLLQFGVAGDNVMPMLKALGNATGGDNERFQHMSLAFGQMSAAGRLMGQDLMQMVNAGFNPLQQIAKTTGKSMAALKQEMEHGRITTQMVMKAFQDASAAGGQFDGLLEKQSKSLGGLWSTLTDNVQIQLKRLSQHVIDAIDLKGLLLRVSNFVQDSQKPLEKWADYFIKQAKGIYEYVAPTLESLWKGFTTGIQIATNIWNGLSDEMKTTIVIVSGIAVGLGPVIGLVGSLAAMVPVMTTAWIAAGVAAISFMESAQHGAKGLVGWLKPVYEGIKKYVVEAIWFAAYTITDFSTVWAAATAGASYNIVKLGNQVVYVFKTVIPEVIGWFLKDWKKTFEYMSTLVGMEVDIIVGDVVWMIKEIARVAREGGDIKLFDERKKEVEEYRKQVLDVFGDSFKIPDRVIGETELQLKKAAENAGKVVKDGFENYKKEKQGLSKFDLPGFDNSKIEKSSLDLGKTIGANLAAGAQHGADQMKGALVGSAGYYDTLYAYLRGKQTQLASIPEMPATKSKKKAGKKKGPTADDYQDMAYEGEGPQPNNPFGLNLPPKREDNLARNKRLRQEALAKADQKEAKTKLDQSEQTDAFAKIGKDAKEQNETTLAGGPMMRGVKTFLVDMDNGLKSASKLFQNTFPKMVEEEWMVGKDNTEYDDGEVSGGDFHLPPENIPTHHIDGSVTSGFDFDPTSDSSSGETSGGDFGEPKNEFGHPENTRYSRYAGFEDHLPAEESTPVQSTYGADGSSTSGFDFEMPEEPKSVEEPRERRKKDSSEDRSPIPVTLTSPASTNVKPADNNTQQKIVEFLKTIAENTKSDNNKSGVTLEGANL